MLYSDENEALVRRLLAGDTSARDELIAVNQPLVYRTVTHIVRRFPASHHFRDELIGAGFVGLVNAVDRLITDGDAQRPIRNFLITTIRNTVISELRQQIRYYQTHRHVDSYTKLPEECLVTEDKSLQQLENTEYLWSRNMSAREQQVIELFLQGKSRRDIAAELQIPYTVVCDRLAAFVRRERRKSQEKVRKCVASG